MYLCILDQAGETLLHRIMTATPEALLKAIACRVKKLMRLRALGCREHPKGGTGSTLQLAKPQGVSVSRLKGFMASQVFDALREQELPCPYHWVQSSI
jgi:hypothetical protein